MVDYGHRFRNAARHAGQNGQTRPAAGQRPEGYKTHARRYGHRASGHLPRSRSRA